MLENERFAQELEKLDTKSSKDDSIGRKFLKLSLRAFAQSLRTRDPAAKEEIYKRAAEEFVNDAGKDYPEGTDLFWVVYGSLRKEVCGDEDEED